MEALNQAPGVVAFAGTEGGGTQVSVRGVGASGPFLNGSSTTGYYLDSVPFGFVWSAYAPNPDVYDLKQIEVLRGPQGTLYGAGGENGVVRVLTNDADLNDFDVKSRGSASYTDSGSGGNYSGDAAVNVPIIEGKLAARAVVGYEDYAGWIRNPDGDAVNNEVRRNFRLKVNASPTENLQIGLSYWGSRDSAGAPSSSNVDRRITTTVAEPISTDFDAYGLKLNYKFSNFSLSSDTSAINFKNISDLSITLAPGPGFYLMNDVRSKVYSEELNLNSTDSGPWKWSAGVFIRDAKDFLYEKIPGLPPGIFYVDYTIPSKSEAIYGQLGRRFLDSQFEWSIGARYFHDDVKQEQNSFEPGLPPSTTPLYGRSATFNAVTPRAVLTWYPNPRTTAYASFSEGFRSGMPQDAIVAEGHPGFVPLKPDKLYNYEVGAKADLGSKIYIEGAVYYMDWRDVQQTTEIFSPAGVGLVASVNGPAATGVGVDFNITVKPVEGLSSGISLSWNNLSLTGDIPIQESPTSGYILFHKGDRLNYSPEKTGSVFAKYTFDVGASGLRGSIDASGNYSSKQMNRGLGFVDTGDDLFFGRVSVGLLSNQWSATVFADNVTNERGGMPAIGLQPGNQWQPRFRPRTIGLQVEYHYR